MKRWMIGLGAVGALAGLGAFAQTSFAQEGFGHGRFPGGMRVVSPDDAAAFTDARIAALHAGLKLTADQEKLWPPVEDAIRGLAKERQTAREARRERFMAAREQMERNIPDMLRFMADRQAASADALRKLADSSAPLYGSLDEGQKRRMLVLARGFMGGGRHRAGMEGRGMGGPGMGGPGMMRRGALERRSLDFAAEAPPATAR